MMTGRLWRDAAILLCAALGVVSGSTAGAQVIAPAERGGIGETCETAIPFPIPQSAPTFRIVDLAAWNNDPPFETPCAALPAASLFQDSWYRYVTARAGTLIVDSCGIGGGEDIRIEVWAGGACPPDVLVACDDNSCGLDSRVAFPVGAGETYLIRFGGSSVAGMQGGGVFSSFGVRVAPFNDECALAEPISGIGSFGSSTVNATDSVVPGDTNPTRRDLWYRWTALETRRFVIRTCAISPRPTRLTVYADVPCADVQTAIVSDPDTGACAPQSEVEFNAVAGQQYLLRVGENPALAGSQGDTIVFMILPVGPSLDLYVDPNSPGGDGTAWDRAFTTLFDATNLAIGAAGAIPNINIRVADGVFRPELPVFVSRIPSLTIAGGYAGFGAPDPDARTLGSTVFDGDILQNDGPNFTNRADNNNLMLYIGVTGSDSVTIEGLRLRHYGGPNAGGQALVVSPEAGVTTGQVLIRDCVFEKNYSQLFGRGSDGAAIAVEPIEGADPFALAIENCGFIDNFADGAGGAIAIRGPQSVSIVGSDFINNAVRDDEGAGITRGGAIYAEQAALELRGCEFIDNSVSSAISGERDAHGGAVGVANNAQLLVARCEFTANRAGGGRGAAIYVDSVSGQPVRIAGSNFSRNRAILGGAIYHRSSDMLDLASVVLQANEADQGTAILTFNPGGPTAQVTLSSCTIYKNTTNGTGGSAVRSEGAPTQVSAANSIIWGNANDVGLAAAAQQASPLARFTFTRCVIPAGQSVIGVALTHADPRLIEGPFDPGTDGIPGTADDLGLNFATHLMPPNSPAVDSGEVELLPPDVLDLDGDGNRFEPLPRDAAGANRVVDDPATPNTGVPAKLPFMDIGGLERDPANPRLRSRSASGAFDSPDSWFPMGLPTANDAAVFETQASQVLTLAGPRTVGQAIFGVGFFGVSSNPPGAGRLVIAQPRADALHIGPWVGSSAVVNFAVPVDVPNGGVKIGAPGSPADVSLSSQGVLIARDTIDVIDGTLELINGGTAVGSDINVSPEGSIVARGFGFLGGTVRNFGRLDFVTPGFVVAGKLEIPASLEIGGDYSQIGAVAGRTRTGTLNVRVGGTSRGDFDELIVQGSLELGGTLSIELINGYTPLVDTPPVTLITPTFGARAEDAESPRGMMGRFDIVNTPGLPGGLFYRAIYNESEGTVTLAVELLSRLIGLQPSDPEATPGTPRNAAVGDLNQDGFPDVAVVIPSATPGEPGDLVILYNDTVDGNPFAGFTAGVQIPVGVDPVAVTIADFDGVNGNDIAVLNRGSADIALFRNAGTLARGGPRPFNPTPRIPAGTRPNDIAAPDLDGDGRPDLAWVGLDGMSVGTVFAALNQGGVGGAWMGIGGPQTVVVEDEPTSIDPADIDDDKDLDLVVGARAASRVIIIPNRGPGGGALRGWAGFGTVMDVPAGEDPTSIDPADIDDDKDLDLIVANGVTGRLAVVLNDGGMTFRPPGFTSVGAQPASVVSIDLDGDADLDVSLLSTVDGERSLQLLRNDLTPDGQVVLTPVPAPAVDQNPVALLKGDMDRDADDDLVVIGEETPIVLGVPPQRGRVVVVVSRPTCTADVSGDGTIGMDDVGLILSNWGSEVIPGTFGDADRDGRITLSDIAAIILQWGEFCGI